MKSSTHILAAGYITMAASLKMNMELDETFIVLAMSSAGSILPDIDKKGSKISEKNLVAGISSSLLRIFTAHRGFTHTIAGAGLISILITLAINLLPLNIENNINSIIGMSLFFGMLSHIVLDSLNPKGVMLIWPLSRKRFNLMNIKTGSISEFIFRMILCFGLIIFAIYFLMEKGMLNL